MKKFFSVLLLSVLALSLFACGKDKSIPDGMVKASGDDVAYTLYVPGGWNTVAESGIYGAYLSTDKSSMTVSSYYGDVQSIDDYWQKAKASYDGTYKNFTIETEEEPTVIGGKKGFKYVFSAEIDGAEYKFMQICAVNSNTLYVFTYTATAESYDTHMSDVEKTVSEFLFG